MIAPLKAVVLVAVALYAAALALLYAFQNRLLYPSAGADPPPTSGELAASGLAPWEGHEGALTAPLDAARATVVVFHGNGGTAAQRGYYADALRRRGLRVILAEYPGYGGRAGRVSEAAFVADARAAIRRAHAAFGGPLVVWGESLGAGVAAAAVRQLDVPVEAVVLLTPWDTLPNVAQGAYPWVPVRALLRDRYDSVEALRAFDGRIAVLVADADAVIPARHGLALHRQLADGQPADGQLTDAAPGRVRLWTFPGAGHNTWPAQPGARWWDEVVAFALGDARPPGPDAES